MFLLYKTSLAFEVQVGPINRQISEVMIRK